MLLFINSQYYFKIRFRSCHFDNIISTNTVVLFDFIFNSLNNTNVDYSNQSQVKIMCCCEKIALVALVRKIISHFSYFQSNSKSVNLLV